MKITKNFRIFVVRLLHFGFCNALSLNLHNFPQLSNSYQITSFISKNFTKVSLLNTSLFGNTPNILHSFDDDKYYQETYDKSSVSGLKSMFSLQESLVVFYTVDLNAVQPFIDFMIPQLSVRQRPKCLVVYFSHFKASDQPKISRILQYAWGKKFLDFSIMITPDEVNVVESNSLIAYFNPFNCIIYQKKLSDGTEIFPDKLQNTFGYSINVSKVLFNKGNFMVVRQPNRKVLWYSYPEFDMKFIGEVIDLNVTIKPLLNLQLEGQDFFEHHNLDIHTQWISSPVSYLSNFFIPIDRSVKNFVAIVPVLRFPRINLSPQSFYSVTIILVPIFTVKYSLKYFKVRIKLKLWDIFLLVQGQSIAQKPKTMVQKIIFLTVIIASVKIMNDFLLDILLVQFDDNEVPFVTYQDLYDSKLQTYTWWKF